MTAAVVKVDRGTRHRPESLRAGFTYARRIREQDGTVFNRYERTLIKEVGIRIAGPTDIDAVFEIRTSVAENRLSYEQLTELGITAESVRDALQASRACGSQMSTGSPPVSR